MPDAIYTVVEDLKARIEKLEQGHGLLAAIVTKLKADIGAPEEPQPVDMGGSAPPPAAP
ncbi:MAG: hypothetical protein ACLP74_08470 [Thermoplasmata archaeon]